MSEITSIHSWIPMKQDDEDRDRQISNNQSECHRLATLSADNKEDNLDQQWEAVYFVNAHCDQPAVSSTDPLPRQWRHANTVSVHTPVPTLWSPARIMEPPLLKRQKPASNGYCESHIVPIKVLLPPLVTGDKYVPQPKAGRDQNIQLPKRLYLCSKQVHGSHHVPKESLTSHVGWKILYAGWILELHH